MYMDWWDDLITYSFVVLPKCYKLSFQSVMVYLVFINLLCVCVYFSSCLIILLHFYCFFFVVLLAIDFCNLFESFFFCVVQHKTKNGIG